MCTEKLDLRYLGELIPDVVHTDHPSKEKMDAFGKNEGLSHEEREEVFEHLSSCCSCRDTYVLGNDEEMPSHKEPKYGC
jgi:hypothetical protein